MITFSLIFYLLIFQFANVTKKQKKHIKMQFDFAKVDKSYTICGMLDNRM